MFKLYELAMHAEQRDNVPRIIVTGLRWRSDINVDDVAKIKGQYFADHPTIFALPPIAVKDGVMYDLYGNNKPVNEVSELTICKWSNNPIFEIIS